MSLHTGTEAFGLSPIPIIMIPPPGFRRAKGAPTSLPACGGALQKTKKISAQASLALIFFVFCGEGGIRTPGGFHLNSFQDCRNRPLYHLS